MVPANSVLLTGADGYLGTLLLREWLNETDLRVLATVRSSSTTELKAKTERVVRNLSPDDAARVEVIPVDLCDPNPFGVLTDQQVQRISRVVHAAAATRFNVPRDLAKAVNVEGTAAVIHLAKRCPNVEVLALCSTIYATGLRAGVLDENLEGDPPVNFANNYEWSKYTAERELLRLSMQVPWRILRLPTVICDDADGTVTQQNAFHRTLRLCFHGLLPVLPGDPTVPLYFASGRFVAGAIRRLVQPDVQNGVYHLSHSCSQAVSLGTLVARAFSIFESVEAFRRRHRLPPPFVDLADFELVASAQAGSVAPILRQVLDSVRPFAPQLFVHKDLRCERFQAILSPPPAPDQLVESALRHLLASDWRVHEAA
jgi:nucleoside-diphosphate-sugar epimerase